MNLKEEYAESRGSSVVISDWNVAVGTNFIDGSSSHVVIDASSYDGIML